MHTPGPSARKDRLLQCLTVVCGAAALYYIAAYGVLAMLHLGFPFALEWVEGSMFEHVRRAFSGQAVYVRPTAEFVPAIYPPLYFYLCAAVSRLVGLSFLAMRLVSFAASVGTIWLVFYITQKETRSRFCGLAAAGLFAATYPLSGPYFDIGRVDSLFLFVFLAAVCLVKFGRSGTSMFLAAALLALAFFTKQTALVLSVPLALFITACRPKAHAAVFIVTFAAAVSAGVFALNRATDGWYGYYVLEIPRQHAVFLEQLGPFWVQDIIRPLPVVCLLGLLYFMAPAKLRPRQSQLFYLMLSAGVLAVAALSRIKIGGFKNVLMPAHAVLAIVFGLALPVAADALQRRLIPARAVARALVCTACIVQLALLLYAPGRLVADERYLRACRAVIQAVGQADGPVCAPSYGYLCAMAGKNSTAHIGCINDVLRANPSPARRQLIDDFETAIKQKRYSAVILDRRFDWLEGLLADTYVRLPGFDRSHPARLMIKYCYVPR